LTDRDTTERTTSGVVGKGIGKLKEVAGSVTDRDDLAREGRLQQAQSDADLEAQAAAREARRHALGNYIDLLARLGTTAQSVNLSALNKMFMRLMPLVAASDADLSAAQLTLPADVRQALNVKEGDYLAAHITKDSVLLTPVQVVERNRAWQGILHAMSQVRDTQPDPNENIIAEEARITEEVKAFRRKHA